ncbi:short-chain dehydrogenase [Mycolicibacterium madagascariense]|uniref:Short-chain dehydrogenase n=1 Tax=Mycolicibacterium madagascariense TaxID=212765 RepID=A0A7I7XI75_9MYCO|nr:SDR family oxidoreductase [Mycolicibacterium madagascariense]MCV7012766.1 SDR family oxidoreductase [Mycolicibacterium madagascariense]BBZ28898.1 short-chain dehydrogenase [Mycolicibacterium madagascariense]
MKFHGKTVLITGATSGIGRETAKLFAQHGAAVIVTGRDDTRGKAVVAEVEELAPENAPARFVAADLNVADDVKRLIQQAGDVDVLVNNAGFWELAPTAQTTEAGLDAMFAVNVKAPFLLTAAFAPAMAGNGGGAIVNVSTMVADRGQAGMAGYGAAKAALESLTRSWAAEYGPQGVRVNAVALGPTMTPAMDPMADMLPTFVAAIPLGRAAQPIEIAHAIAYLSSDDSSFITGAIVPVDGGRQSVL